MRLCFIADARSTTARNWIGYFIAKGHEVHVVSTFASNAIPGSVLHALVPTEPRPTGLSNRWKPWINPTGAAGSILAYVSYSLEMPVKYLFHRDRVRSIVREVRPEILHSLRIPIEGELGAYAGYTPFVVSVWGNDFTLHARQFPFHNFKTREVIRKVNGLFADSNIDLERAKQF